jgi:diguanylate cyclase (GGDEF)-like protein
MTTSSVARSYTTPWGTTAQRVIGMFQDITDRKELEQKLRAAATRDPLTGAFNRAVFQEHLQQAVTTSLRGEDQAALFLLDLDRFKEVNDRYGHSAGDVLLKVITQRVLGCIRAEDSLARIGGDEFAIIMNCTHGSEEAKAVANRILKVLEEPIVHDRFTFHARGSIGVALSPGDGETPEALLRSADVALYHAKEGGRATFSLFESEMRQASDAQAEVIQKFRRALKRDEVVPYYQPEIDLRTGRVIGVEALARWVDATDGVRGPADFSAALGDPATCRLLGASMIEKVVGDLARWNATQVPVGIVAVNVTGVELRQDDFPDHVLAVLEKHGVPHEQLKLEVTESTLLDRSSERTLKNLRSLRGLGVKIALDDFGTGFASLTHLLTLPVDVLKIDRSFISRAATDPRAAAIAEAIITLGQSLELLVVAEGVETDRQVEWLRNCGCDVAQGYWIAPPMPYEEVAAFFQAFGRSAVHGKSIA